MHLIHLLTHCLYLLLCRLQFWRLVILGHQLGINCLGKSFCHLLRPRPVHVLDEKIARHSPQLRVALQQLAHRVQRLLALGHVAWASGHAHIVHTHAGVVYLLDCYARLIHNLLHRLGLVRVDLSHASLTVHADDSRYALGVVYLGYQVHHLPGGVTDGSGQVVYIVVGAGVALLLTRQYGPSAALVACGT